MSDRFVPYPGWEVSKADLLLPSACFDEGRLMMKQGDPRGVGIIRGQRCSEVGGGVAWMPRETSAGTIWRLPATHRKKRKKLQAVTREADNGRREESPGTFESSHLLSVFDGLLQFGGYFVS